MGFSSKPKAVMGGPSEQTSVTTHISISPVPVRTAGDVCTPPCDTGSTRRMSPLLLYALVTLRKTFTTPEKSAGQRQGYML